MEHADRLYGVTKILKQPGLLPRQYGNCGSLRLRAEFLPTFSGDTPFIAIT
ncbi:MAG TPA: hypothetical protein PKV62_04060 [Oscillospiraceae bacterium]|nr:hypothetical protein [Oscillospiraceae bacterium]